MTAVLLAVALAGAIRDDFANANQAYYRGDFAGAAAGYRRVIDAGVISADVYYNLGGAELRAGRIGAAIWNYQRALQLSPGDEGIEWNLAAARRQAETRWRDRLGGASVEPWWARLANSAIGRAAPTVFTSCWCAVFLVLWVRRALRGMSRAVAGTAAGLFGITALCFGLLLAGREVQRRVVRRAIVVSDEVAVAEGPDERARTSFRVHGGLEVRIVERDDSWLRVRLPNGLEGWVRERDLGRL